MKTFKKIIVCSLALTLTFCGSGIYPGSNSSARNTFFAEAQKSSDWEYKIYDKIDGICQTPCIEITKYKGNGDIVDIPEKIGDYPVVSIAKDAFSQNQHFECINVTSTLKRFDADEMYDSVYVLSYENNFNFYINEDHTLRLDSYEGTDSDIEIPSHIAGCPVTALYDYVFSDNKIIKSVKLPDTINCFGRYVFKNSTLEKINIPDSLKILPSNTFSGCTNLSDVELNDNVIIAKNAFKDTPVILPESALSYETGTCAMSFNDIIIDKGPWRFKITYDKENSRYLAGFMMYNYQNDPLISDTNKKADVDIPESFFDIPVTSIDDLFWEDCNSAGITLKSITFPSGINIIWNLKLASPSELKSVTIKAENPAIYQGLFQSTGIEEITLHGSCDISENAFSDCENLKKIIITGESENIKISAQSFYNCKSLEEISFPDNSDVKIGINAFRGCSSLKELKINGNASVSSNAFRECDDLKTVRISGKADLSSGAFLDDKALTDIFVDTDSTLDGSAFNGCSNLMNINSISAFDPKKKDLVPELKSFILDSFYGSEDVGFIDPYIQSQAEKIVSEYTDSSMSDLQKAKILHDWVCNKVTYDNENVNDPRNKNDGSIFMSDTAVCEGYAKGYNLLLNTAGIESVFVGSSNHAWNIIKLGSHYFHVDTTWDDSDKISYDWFLKTDSEVSSETSSHSKWSTAKLSSLHDPVENVPECKYSMGDLNTDGNVNTADMVILNKYILGIYKFDSDNYILSDLDFDGTIDSFDLVCLRKILLNG